MALTFFSYARIPIKKGAGAETPAPAILECHGNCGAHINFLAHDSSGFDFSSSREFEKSLEWVLTGEE